MSDDYVEEFSVSDRDLRSAMNPTRRRGRQSKEEAIYGIWANEAERMANRPTSSSATSYGRPFSGIPFVSGGVKLGSKIEKEKPVASKPTTEKRKLIESYGSDEESEEELNDDNDSDVEVIEKKPRRRRDSSDEDDDDDDDEKEDDDDDGGDGDKANRSEDSSDGGRDSPIRQREPVNVQYKRPAPPPRPTTVDKDFGAFEKYTRGIGSKLMMKMGYKKGMGLGKNLHGRAEPIQVVKRSGKGAVGHYGNEDPNRNKPATEADMKDSKKSKKEGAATAPQWRKQGRERPPKQQYTYKTFNDVIKEQTIKAQGKKGTIGQSREKIIDMTGREQRVLQNYESLTTKSHYDSNENERIFSLDELTHNLDLVIESCEESMIRSDRRRKFDEDTTVALEYEMKATQTSIYDEEDQMNRLNTLLSMVDRCERYAEQTQNVTDLYFLQTIFDEIKSNYYREYQKYRLWDLTVPILHQPLKDQLNAEFRILQGDQNHDQHLIEIFRKWKTILEDDSIDLTNESGIPTKDTMDPYHRLIWDVWMPFLRRAILDWDPRQPDRLIDCIERWIPCSPKWILENIYEKLVFPKLQYEVDAWDPLRDSVPIHSWLHPWLPLMNDRLEPLYQPIRTKLAQALQSWQPCDSSAKAVLLPWKSVFKQATWDAFINKYIVPKLIILMQQFVIDPRQQVLEPWHWFMAWYDMAPLSSMIAILEKSFFPQWLQVLNVWLNTNPSYQEIERWYSGWRSLIPASIINHTAIKEKLTEGLMMIDRSLPGSSRTVPPQAPPQSTPININFEAIFNQGVATSSSTVVSSFKDLIEKKAADHNLLFLPIPNRTFEGKQVYRFGNANIYIDKNVIFMYERGQWLPLRLNDLVAKAV